MWIRAGREMNGEVLHNRERMLDGVRKVEE
jgi:hypothetical protein